MLGKLTPTQRATDDSTFAAKVASANARIALLASSLSTSESRLIVAETSAEFNASQHTWDGTHPNSRGELRIAAAYADSLASGFGIGARFPRPYEEPALGPREQPVTTITVTGASSADLRWTPSVGATSYWVWMKDQGFNPEWTRLPLPLSSPDHNPWQINDLVPGMTYHWKLQTAKGWDVGVYSNEVTLTVAGSTPGPATNFTVTSGDAKAQLRWAIVAGATGYLIHQRNVTAGESEFVRLPFPVPGPQWDAEGLVNGMTYEYRLQPVNGMIDGPTTAAVAVRPFGPVPTAVADLTTESLNAKVTLRWSPVIHATGYFVYIRNLALNETAFTRLPWPVGGPEWTAEGLMNGATYEFRVASANGIIEGGQSSTATARPITAPPIGPADLRGAAGNGEVALTWSSASDATGYYVHMRNVTAGETSFTKLPWPVPGTEWTARGLTNGMTYEFKLQSVAGLINGSFSQFVTARPIVAAPAGPIGLTAVAGNHEARLTWTAAVNATAYWVHMKNVSAGEIVFTRLPFPITGTEWRASGLINGGKYQFMLQSQSGIIDGGLSSAVSVNPVGPAPVAPSGFSIRAGDHAATLSWNMPTDATSVYVWMRNVAAGEQFARLPYPIWDDTWTAGGLSNGVTYEFRLQSYNDLIPGGTTGAVSVIPRGLTPALSNFIVRPGNQKAILTWDGTTAANNYHIWIREVTLGKSWAQLPYPVSGESFVAGYLTNGASYEFKIQAYSDSQAGAWSPAIAVVPAGPTPQVANLSVYAWLGAARLQWSTSPTSTGYLVQLRNVTRNESFTQLPYPVVGSTFTAGLLTPGHRYEFRLLAVSGLQNGVYSNVVSVVVPLPFAPGWVSATQGGPYEARLAWAEVPGADGYMIYHGVSASIWDVPVLQRMPYPVQGTSFTVSYLLQPGVHFWYIAATKYGSVGPISATGGTMSPLMENPFYFTARHRYFDAAPGSGDRKAVTSAGRASYDGGIVVARAFIAPTGIYGPIGDYRSFLSRYYTVDPNGSARIAAAWDTHRGQLGVYAQKSCVYSVCSPALPIVLGYSGADDTDRVYSNYVWKSGSGDSLTVNWKASNSDTNGTIWPLTGHIDTEIFMWRANSRNFGATLRTDHFPAYEVYQYPHYTTNGFPEARTLVQCDQYQINGLLDTPAQRRTCS